MRTRRELITLLGGAAAAWPLAARAQQPERMRRIGMLWSIASSSPESSARLAAFAQGLQQSGWTVGQNLRIEHRWGSGSAPDIRKYAAELVALAPDVILAVGTQTAGPLLEATRAIPIVFVQVADPVGAGFVESLARPGGNATGFANFEYGISGKWLELLKEIAPRLTRAAVLRDPSVASGTGQLGAIQSIAPSMGVELTPVDLRSAAHPRVSGSTPAARNLFGSCLRGLRGVDLVWARSTGSIPPRGRIRRPHSQGRETG